MFAAGKRSGFAPALDSLQANVVWLYSGARKKKKIMNSDELDSSEPVVHMHTRSS
jgi:hypothetical protein